MKKLIWIALFIGTALTFNKVQASVLTDLWVDIGQNTHLTIVEEAVPNYFYNIAKGRSEVGIVTPVVAYRFISGDFGYSTGYNDNSRGTVLMGGSIHFDKLAAQLFPKVAALANAGIDVAAPSGLAQAWKKLYISFLIGRDTTESDLNYGVATGFQFHW